MSDKKEKNNFQENYLRQMLMENQLVGMELLKLNHPEVFKQQNKNPKSGKKK